MAHQLIFTRRFSMAHRLISGASPKCAVPHGHNEYVRVKIENATFKPLDHKANLIELFENIKKTWHHFIDNHIDHAFQLSNVDPLINFFVQHEQEKIARLVITPGDPSTEMLCCCLMSKLQRFLSQENKNLHCVHLEVEETPTNKVSLIGYQAYKEHLPQEGEGNFWWNRTDYSINDLDAIVD